MNAQTPFVSLYGNLSTADLGLIAHRVGADSCTHATRTDAVALLAEVHRLRLAVALVRGYYDDLLDAVRRKPIRLGVTATSPPALPPPRARPG